MIAVPGERPVGLDGVVARGDLRRRTEAGAIRPFRPTGFDRNLLEVADAALATRLPTALVLPVPGTHTGALLAASILVSHFVHTRRLTAQVALATKQLRLRAFYDTLYIGQQSRLADFFPRTVVAAGGIVSEVGERPRAMIGSGYSGRLHFVSELERVAQIGLGHAPGSDHLDGVVIESQASEEQALRRLLATLGCRVPILYLTVDPTDPLLAEFERVGAVWAWDSACMSLLAGDRPNPDAICAGTATLRSAADTTFEVKGPDQSTDVDRSLACLWDDLVEVQRHPGGVTFDTVRWVWGVFGALSQLALPVDEYDRYARAAWGTTALADAPQKAETFARNTLRPEDRDYWLMVAHDLDTAVRAARRTNPKPQGLVTWVRERIEKGSPGIVAVRNRAAVQATLAYLQARPDVPFRWADAIQVLSYSELMAGRPEAAAGELLVAGPLSGRFGGLLALPAARRLTLLAHGPWEAGRAARQIRNIVDRLEALAHGATRQEAVRKLFRGQDPGPCCDPRPLRLSHSALSTAAIPRTAREAVWDPFDVTIVRSLGREDVDAEGPMRDSPHGPQALTRALYVRFSDGSGFFEPDSLISKVEGRELREVAAKSLTPGDRIILIDRGARRDLFDLVVEKLEDLPEFTAVAMLVLEWHERARRAVYLSGLTYEEILYRMGPTTITSPATIGTWVRGNVHGPLRAEDIRRFGHAVDDGFLVDHWEAIGRALATMRSHRRKIGHMLARVLTGLSTVELEDGGYFDRRLGIHYSDFTEAVSDHFVSEVSRDLSSVPYQYANRLLEPEEAARIAG
jgi:hypothetical protein